MELQLLKLDNNKALAKIEKYLPAIEKQTKAFDRNNSQTTLSMMSLTMLNGQSPMRMLRQTLAEIEKRKLALNEAQYNLSVKNKEIKNLKAKDNRDEVDEAQLRMFLTQVQTIENKANGSLKDIATLIDAYNSIKDTNDIDSWDEATYEAEEKKHHIRRGFELLYRNLIEVGRAKEATIEYMQQYGVHIQVALSEVQGFIHVAQEAIKNGHRPHSNEIEDFLDDMMNKYYKNADETTKRIFGKESIINSEYMLLGDTK